MTVANSVLKFVFGPCLDNSAVVVVEPRHVQPRSVHRQQPQRHYQSWQKDDNVRCREPNRLHYIPPNSKRLIFSPKSKRWDDPPKKLERSIELQTQTGAPEINQGHNDANGTDSRRYRNDDSGMQSYYAKNSDHETKSHSRHNNYNGGHSDHNLVSLNDNSRRRYRRDDAFHMSASLIETYRGCSFEDQTEYFDEQSALRRNFKESSMHQKNQNRHQAKGKVGRSQPQHSVQRNGQQRRDPPDAFRTSGKSTFEIGLEKMNEIQSSCNAIDDDNITTISKASKNPYYVLGISKQASSRELYSTYEMRLKEAEQSGASDKAFQDVGNAYRRIQAEIKRQQQAREERRIVVRREEKFNQHSSSDEDSDAKTRRECIDARLKDHRELVQRLFADDNNRQKDNRHISSNNSVSSRGHVSTLQNSVHNQECALAAMNLVPVEAGALNINEQNQTIQNSCFYLSLAASYLSGVGAFVEDPTDTVSAESKIAILENEPKQLTMKLALHLKRAIEAAVLLVHPDWAKSGLVGEEVQAFSDYLVYALDSDSMLSHFTIAVFDDESGFVDIYRGRHYGKIYPPTERTARHRERRDGQARYDSRSKWKYKDCDPNTKRTNTLTLRYTTGHYQPLLPELTKMRKKSEQGGTSRCKGLAERPALEDILGTLEKWKVLHVVTDGRADCNSG
jgi:hypothetical protein